MSSSFFDKIKSVFLSRTCFFILMLLACLLVAFISEDDRYSHSANPVFHVSGALCLTLLFIALTLGRLCYSYRKKEQLIPSAKHLWTIIAVAFILNFLGNFQPYTLVTCPFSSLLSTAGVICISWWALKQYSLIFWIPFLFFELVQLVIYLNTGIILHSELILAEILGVSKADIFYFLTAKSLIALLLAFIIACGACLFMWRAFRNMKRAPLATVGLIFLTIACIDTLATARVYRHSCLWPLLEIKMTTTYAYRALQFNDEMVNTLKSLPSPAEQPSSIHTLHADQGAVLVIHVGESVRADRLSINGYKNKGRSTTPFLDSINHSSLISYSDCISSACNTCAAMYTILTDARRDIRACTETSFCAQAGSVLELFTANQFSVYAIQGTNEAMTGKFDMVVSQLLRCAKSRYCAKGISHTALPRIEQVLQEAPIENKVLFLNNEGSHSTFGAYDKAHAPFQPAATEAIEAKKQLVELNNSYDNTIYYTDAYIRKVVSLLEGRPYIYIYISDHGEFIGHEGACFRGHGIPYHDTAACRVGMFIITSPEFEALHPHFAKAVANLRAHKDMTVGHEHIYHTLLGIFGIKTPYYDANLDLSGDHPEPYTGPQPKTKPQPDSFPATLTETP